MSEPDLAALEAQFLSGAIADEFLPKAGARGFDDLIVNVWSTPVCRWVTRHLCTGIFCPNPGTTRDPTTCENR
jgi:hypothetical protein